MSLVIWAVTGQSICDVEDKAVTETSVNTGFAFHCWEQLVVSKDMKMMLNLQHFF